MSAMLTPFLGHSLGQRHQPYDQEERDLERAHRARSVFQSNSIRKRDQNYLLFSSLGLPVEQSPPQDRHDPSQPSNETERTPPHDQGSASRFLKDNDSDCMSDAADYGEDDEDAEQFFNILMEDSPGEEQDEHQDLEVEEATTPTPLSRWPMTVNQDIEPSGATVSTSLRRQPRTERREMGPRIGTARSHDNDSSPSTPRQASFTSANPSLPFKLENCEDEDRQLILQYALAKDEPIAPYYNAHSVHLDDPDREIKNFDISLLLAFAGNAALYEEALAILYGENFFGFDNPRVMLWWMKRIGDNSTRKLRHLTIQFTEGQVHYRGYTIEDAREERLWYNTLLWFKPRQQLEEVLLCFNKWTDGHWEKAHWHVIELWEIEMKRRIYHLLLSFRGLGSVHINPGKLIQENEVRTLITAMTLDVGATTPQEVTRMGKGTLRMGSTKWSMA